LAEFDRRKPNFMYIFFEEKTLRICLSPCVCLYERDVVS
jgi:hypothetical protein